MKKYFSKAIFAFLFALFATNILLILPQISNARGYENEEQLARIQETIKNQKKRWTAEHNAISDLSDEEKKKLVGDISNFKTEAPADTQASAENMFTATTGTLDWRNNNGNFVTPIKNQGNCGSCWAFGVTASVESAIMIAKKMPYTQFPLDLSEQHLVSCGGSGSCNGGSSERAGSYISLFGIPSESCFKYVASESPCTNVCADWKNQAYKAVWLHVGDSVENLKKALNTYGSITTVMGVYADFFYYRKGVYSRTSNNMVGAHAVSIVGYDDIGQYLIVKNSWGPVWGEAGFFRIAYSEVGHAPEGSFGTFSQGFIPTYFPPVPLPTPTYTPSPTEPYTIFAPNGGELWQLGSTQTIRWNYSTNFGTGSNVKIYLMRNNAVVSTIAGLTSRGTDNSGLYSWKIPSTLTPASDYRIKIVSYTNGTYYDLSDQNFSLTASPTSSPTPTPSPSKSPTPTPSKSPSPTPSPSPSGGAFTVISPNGNESWQLGSTQTIKWAYSANYASGNYVKVYLTRNNSIISTISYSASRGTNGSGSVAWKVPYALAAGSDYKIKVISSTNTNYFDTSDQSFSLVTPPSPIALTYPNGGETLKAGTKQTITWTSSTSTVFYLRVELYKGGVRNKIIGYTSSNKKSAVWNVPATQASGNDYKIKLVGYTAPYYAAESVGNFTILQ